MIYNDVIVYHSDNTAGNPHFDIYGYPENVFPPTDFHSATYIPGHNAIFIIGNLGYGSKQLVDSQARGETPVYRLEIGTWKIEKVDTNGPGPGWIYHHQALEGDEQICVLFDGETRRCLKVDGKIESVAIDKGERWVLDLKSMAWKYEI